MREIEFRAWNRITERYYYNVQATHDADIGDSFQNVLDNDELIVEQSTGINDKNGVDIYDGDYIRTKSNIYKVEWFNTAFWAIPDSGHGSSQPISRLYEYEDGTAYGIEVIGNIHENSELLEEK